MIAGRTRVGIRFLTYQIWVISVLLTWGPSHAVAQFGGFCCFGPPARSISQKIAESDVALVAYCVSITPKHPDLYDRYRNLADRRAIIERRKAAIRREQELNPPDFVEIIAIEVQAAISRYRKVIDDELELAADEEAARADQNRAVLGLTTYEVRWIGRGPADFHPGQKIRIFEQPVGKPGKQFLLLGKTQLSGINWTVDQALSEAALEYARQLPTQFTPEAAKLSFFFDAVDSDDEGIANDALRELERADELDLRDLAIRVPRETLRMRFVNSCDRLPYRDFYASLLGQVGDFTDGKLIEDQILASRGDEGGYQVLQLVHCYLQIMRDRGMDVIDEHILRGRQWSDSEKLWMLEALNYTSEFVSQERINQTMRQILTQPELATTAIQSLTSAQDWSAQNQIAALYGEKDFDTKQIRKAVIGYLLASSTDLTCLKDRKLPWHVLTSIQHLNQLRKRDRRTYLYARQVLFSRHQEDPFR